jgi:ADP-dependent NAD(P)H-hydrate dehydratase / NAD(P)H-hydrate epimerase
MQRILPNRQPWPLHGVAASRRVEAQALAAPGLPPHALMQRAGVAVARLSLALAPHAGCTWVLAGPGNNGGDGAEAAYQLQLQGRAVRLNFIGDTQRLPADAAHSFERARSAGVVIEAGVGTVPPKLGANDIAIDALLGLGSRRPLDTALATAAHALNALPCPVLAVDLPSGLDGDTGQPTGDAVVRASHSLSLLTLKPGLFTGRGRDLAGTVWFDDLGQAPERGGEPDAWLAGPPQAMKRREHAQHKGSFGDLRVVGGAPGMGGAAWLAARAAHAAGAGRVWVVTLDPQAPPLDPQRPELMWAAGMDMVDESAWGQSTVVCGCGGGEPVAATLPRLMATVPRLLLDADALNAVAADQALQQALAARAARGQASVLTPHPLEAARLLGSSTPAIQADRLAAAKDLAQRYGCVVVLKGSGSVIAAPGQPARLNPTGDASLASPGTGDVLAGWLGGRWSALAGAWQGDASAASPAALGFEAACLAVWEHGAASQQAGQRVMRAADLVDRLAESPDG